MRLRMIRDWLTVPDAAKAAKVTERTIYRWINTGMRSRTSCGTTFVYVPHLAARLDRGQTDVRESR